MKKTVFGVFDSRKEADNALTMLEERGYDPRSISVIMRESGEIVDKGGSRGEHLVKGATSGATTGAVVGGIAGLLVGVGAIVVPGIGGILIGGPLAAALGLTGAAATAASGAVTGAVAGGLVGGLMGFGVPEENAKIYERRLKAGAILLAVPVVQDQDDEVTKTLKDCGADEVRVAKA